MFQPAFIFQNVFEQRRGVFNGSAGSRLGSSDQHLLHFSPSGPGPLGNPIARPSDSSLSPTLARIGGMSREERFRLAPVVCFYKTMSGSGEATMPRTRRRTCPNRHRTATHAHSA
jgi:hypothetical protein